jgi:hypothetical protein
MRSNPLLHAVGAFDALAQVRAKREQEYQARCRRFFAPFFCVGTPDGVVVVCDM